MSNFLDRIPPQNMESEQAALGSMLLEWQAISTACECLTVEDFYRESHRIIFTGIMELFHDRKPVDLITLGEWLKSRDYLDSVGGTLYLGTLMEQTPTAAGISHYAKIIRKEAVKRAMIRTADELMEQAYASTDEPEDTLKVFIEKFENMTAITTDMYSVPLSDLVNKNLWELEDAIETGITPGIKSGWREVNNIIKDLIPGDLIIVAGQSGMGKTAFMAQWANDLCQQGYAGLIHSLEMTGKSLSFRTLLTRMRFNRRDVRNIPKCKAQPEIVQDMAAAAETVFSYRLRIDDRPDVKLADIEKEARKVKRHFGKLDFIMVDFLQIVSPDKAERSMYEKSGTVAYGLKAIGKKIGCPVFALVQLNIEGERESPKVPRITHIAESGKIRQAADLILYLYRPGHYGEEEVTNKRNNMLWPEQRFITEVGILKQRDEEADRRGHLVFNGEHMFFRDLNNDEWASMHGKNRQEHEERESAYSELGGN